MRCHLRSVEIKDRLNKLNLLLKMHDISAQVAYGKGKPEYTRRVGGWRSYPWRFVIRVDSILESSPHFTVEPYWETTKFFATLPELEAFAAKIMFESIQDG